MAPRRHVAAVITMISQILLPRADGSGRVAAREILVVSHAISAIIREGKTHQIYSAIQTGTKEGMITMEKSLAALYRDGLLSEEDALTQGIAAIAAAVLLGLCEPAMTGLGGDCFVLLKPAGSEEIIGLNGSGRAPGGLDAQALRPGRQRAGAQARNAAGHRV